MKDEKGVFSRASWTEEIEKYGKRIFCKTRQGAISGNPGLREMDERYISDGPSEEQDRPGNRIRLHSSPETLPLCQWRKDINLQQSCWASHSPVGSGRKNRLFCGNDASAYRAAIVYSLIGTCKNACIEQRLWMEDVLKQIPYYQRDGRDLAELLPRAWSSRNQLWQSCCD